MLSRYKSDARIVGEVLKGRVDEFELLVRRYLPALRAIASSRVGNTQDIEDLVQEILLKAFQALDSLRDRDKFGPWLACTARNTCANFVREQKRQPQRVELGPVLIGSDLTVENEEIYRLVRDRLRAMDEDTREILLLHYYAGKSTREMAGLLQLSREAVKKRLQRARDVLGKDLALLLRPVPEESQRWDRQARNIMGLVGVNLAPWLKDTATAGAAAASVATSAASATTVIASIVAAIALAITAGVAINWKDGTVPQSDSTPAVMTQPGENPAQTTSQPAPQTSAHETGVIAGRVVMADSGKPVPNAAIDIQFYRAALWHTKANEKGEFRVDHFPAGMFSLDIDHPELILAQPCSLDLDQGSQLTDIIVRVHTGGIITGRVLDKETGEGVAGVEVHTTYLQLNDRKTISAQDGAYRLTRLPDQEFYVSYEPPRGYAAGPSKIIRVTPGQVVENINFSLGKGLSISGRLVDPSRQPLGGLKLFFDAPYTTTALDGSFLANGLSPYTIVRCQLYDEKHRYVIPRTTFELKDKDLADVTIEAKESASISGRIVTPEGKGIAKASVSMKPVDPPDAENIFDQETDAEGAFSEDDIYPGAYEISVSPPRNVEGFMSIDLGTVELRPGQRLVNQRYVYDSRQTLSIAGRVVDTNGTPLPDIRFAVIASNSFLSPQTDSAGSFLITDLKPGEYQLCSFMAPGLAINDVDKTVQAGDMNVQIVLEFSEDPQAPPGSEIDVTVVDAATGKPATEFDWGVSTLLDKPIEEIFETDLGYTPVQDPEGKFQVRYQYSEYRLVIWATGYAPSISTIRSGETYKIALTPGFRLTGRVLDSDGQPVAGAVLVRGKRAPYSPCSIPTSFNHPLGRSDSEGAFTICDLAADPQEITAGHPDFGNVTVRVSPGAKNSPDVVIRFPPAGRLEGEITWDGAPVSAALSFVRNGEIVCSSFAEAGTTYSVPGLPPGPYQIRISPQLDTPGLRCSCSQDITVNMGLNHFDYDFVPGTTTLFGKASIDGAPVTQEFEVRIQYVETGLLYDLRVTPDETGSFRIDELPPGNVSIDARGEYQGHELSFTVALTLPTAGSVEQDFVVSIR